MTVGAARSHRAQDLGSICCARAPSHVCHRSQLVDHVSVAGCYANVYGIGFKWESKIVIRVSQILFYTFFARESVVKAYYIKRRQMI